LFSSTPQNGFLLLGGNSTTGNKTAWQNMYNVVKGQEYTFTLFYMNGNASQTSIPENYIQVQLNGVTVNREKVKFISGRLWQELTVKWIADDNQVLIKIINEVNHTGNIVAIDDISLRSFCACNDVPLAVNANFDNYDYDINYTDVFPNLQLNNATPHNLLPVPPNPIPPGLPNAAMQYNIFKFYGTAPAILKDHNRPRKGSFMVFKLDNNVNSNQAVVWRQIINVVPFTEFNFSAWFSAQQANTMMVEMYVNGTLVTKASNDATVAPDWFVLGGRWTSGNANQAELVIKVINTGSGNDPLFFAVDDIVFRRNCQGNCEEKRVTEVSFDSPEENCVEHLTNIAHHNARIRYDEYISGIEDDFREQYIAKCLDVYEDFYMREQDNGHHFTLYYYDQSGQLIRTVPPKGFTKITNDDELKRIRIDRANGKRTVFTNHSMTTTYAYNSLNQLVQQSVPDNDDMEIWDVHEYGTNHTASSGLNASAFANNFVGSATGVHATNTSLGGLFKTSNSGKTWTPIDKVATGKPKALQLVDGSNDVFMLTSDQKLLHSIDNGENWEITNVLPIGKNYIGMHFTTATVGMIADDEGNVYNYTIAVPSWTLSATESIPVTGTDRVRLVHMFDANYGFALTVEGKIINTTDGWASIGIDYKVRSVGLNKVEMFDANVGHAVGKDGTLLCTENAGDSWKEIPSKLTANLINVHFRSHTTGCALDDAGNLYATTNKGVEWNKIEDPISSSDKIAAFDFHSKQVGLSITKKGKLFGTVNGGVNWIKLQEAEPALDGTSNYFNTLDMISATEAFATDYSNKLYYIKFILNQWYISTCSACSLALPAITPPPPTPPTTVKAAKIQFSNLEEGAVLGSDNNLYYITISGISTVTDDVPVTTFTISTPADVTPVNNLFSDIKYVSPILAYALTKDGKVYKSIDQGDNWTSLAQVSGTGTEFSSIAIEPTSNSIAIVVGTAGEIFIPGTTSGTLDDKSYTVTPPTINTMHTVKVSSTSVKHTYAVGDDGTVLYRNSTTNKWNTLTTGTSNNLHAVAFKDDENNGIISGENGFAAVTVNAGTSWTTADFYTATLSGDPTKEVPHTQADYTAALAISTTEFYVAGTEGWMFKYTIAGSPILRYHDPKTTQDIVLMTGDGTNQLLAGHQADVSYFDPTLSIPGWVSAETLLPSVLHDMHLMSNNVGYAVGNNGNIIKTTNGGQSWTSISSPTSGQLKAVDFVDELNGYIAGNNGIIYRTTNGGISWTNCSTHVNTANHIYDVHLVDANLAFICGANNTVYYSRNPFNASPTWTSFSSPVSGANLNAIHTVDGAVGYAVGDNDVMLKFELNLSNNTYSWKPRLLLNSVTPWIEHHTPTSGVNITDVKFRDHKTGYVVAANGALLKTTDAGETWTLEKTNSAATPLYNSVNYRHLCLVDDHHLFLSGDGSNTKNFLYLYDQKHEFSSRFYYDKLGRLVVSQNAEQYARGLALSKNIYSYTTYDFKGRITEVGEVAATTDIETLYNNNTVLEGNRMNETDYLNWLGANTRTQVTKTYYDYQAISPAGSPVTVNSSFNAYTALPDHEYTATFDNLRSRVSAITYENTHDGVDNTYQYAVFYSYDVHGNVKTILNEANIDLGNSNNRYVLKQVDYEYDLVSGKVNRVVLNPWKKDKFIHRYEYDADNRITQVFTSHDGVIWQNDARYQYYKHGPLARTELGSDNVQGLDYAYTMQGWLKGVNSNTLVDNERDMGKDGFRNVSNPNANFAPDEFGFALNYFNGDYAAINSPVPTKHFMAEMPVASNLSAANVDLFNGNISHMVTAIRQFMLGDGPGKKPQAMVYNYDQLNRLKATHKLQNVNLVNNQWNSNIDLDDDYTETYTYDANGNILTLKRKGISNCGSPASNEIDDLVYKYEHPDFNSQYSRKTNRLRAVLDGVTHAVAPGTNDIKNGQPWLHLPGSTPADDNYQYDRLGNLIKDVQEEIENIEWTTYGKIKSITRTQNSLKPDLEFAYDPSGNRVLKIVKPHDPGGTGVMLQQYWKYTYYVRDAQGNTLANYNHFGDRPYEAESYLLYGSSRIGEYVPRKYTNSCGENIDVTMWTNWEDAGNWAQAYLHRLGYDVSYQTYWFDQWKNIGYDFNSITSPKALQALANAWMEWMCNTRCLRYGQMNGDYTAAFDAFWAQCIGEASAAGGFTDFSATYMHNLENYVWPSGFELLKTEYSGTFSCDDCNRFTYAKGSRHFELSNHLGNVLVTVSDRKIAVDEEYTYNPAAANRYLRNGSYTASADGDFELINTADGLASEYLAEVISANDYYPFGMIMPGRSYVKPLSCNGSENCTHPEQILMDGHTQSWQNYGSANSVYNSTEDRQEITMNAPNSGAEFTVNGTPTGNEITTVSMVVQAGTYNDVTVEVYDMGNTLVPGMQQVVMAGQTDPVAFNFPSSQTAYKVRLTGANTANLNVTTGWTNTANWQTTGTGSINYNSGTQEMEITAAANNDGAHLTYTVPANGQGINLTATLETGSNPVTVELFDNNNNLLQSALFVTPNNSNNINFTVNNNTAGTHRLLLRGSPVMQPNPVTIYTDDFNSTWTTTGTANATHNINTNVAVTVNNYNDGVQRTVTTPGNGNPLDFDLLLNTGTNSVTVELYDPGNSGNILPPVNVPANSTASPVNFYLSSGTLSSYGIRTRGNPTPQNNQIVTNGETSLAWAGINNGITTYNSPNLEITNAGPGDGALANFTTTIGGAVTGSLQVQAVNNDVLVEVYDNSSNLVAGPFTVTLGNTSTVNFNFTAATTQHQIRITNTTANGYNDNIYVTAFNVWENILVPDNYTITQLTVKETQYIAVPDVFKLSNLSVTATPYPDVAHVHQLNVSYAKPYNRPLCANNNDKLTDINKQTRGFNGMERDDEVYGDGNSYDFGARIYNPRIGRFLSVDPLAMTMVGLSPYMFAANCPIRYIDVLGLAPGDPFRTPEEAAHDFGLLYNDNSIVERVEYGAFIYKIRRNGQIFYTYNVPTKGKVRAGNVNIRRRGVPLYRRIIADVHTHEDFQGEVENESDFSPKDRRLALRHRNRRSFVIGPDGRMREFNKKEYRSEILFEDLPSDPNPRNKDRANTVSPIELPKDEKFRNEREPLLPTEEYHKSLKYEDFGKHENADENSSKSPQKNKSSLVLNKSDNSKD
jgi:RHS repeat-associated protein